MTAQVEAPEPKQRGFTKFAKSIFVRGEAQQTALKAPSIIDRPLSPESQRVSAPGNRPSLIPSLSSADSINNNPNKRSPLPSPANSRRNLLLTNAAEEGGTYNPLLRGPSNLSAASLRGTSSKKLLEVGSPGAAGDNSLYASGRPANAQEALGGTRISRRKMMLGDMNMGGLPTLVEASEQSSTPLEHPNIAPKPAVGASAMPTFDPIAVPTPPTHSSSGSIRGRSSLQQDIVVTSMTPVPQTPVGQRPSRTSSGRNPSSLYEEH